MSSEQLDLTAYETNKPITITLSWTPDPGRLTAENAIAR
jgi:hypothetical protein